jgi:DNA-binding Lrp family transcriptional regulator
LLTAFLLVTTEIGSESKVMRMFEKIDAVEEVYLASNVYDIIVKIMTQSMDELKEIVTSNLVRSNGVRSTSTMIILPEKPVLNTITEEILTVTN